MGTRPSFVKIPKCAIVDQREVIFNRNSDLAFDSHLGDKNGLELSKYSLFGSAAALYRRKLNTELYPEDYGVFSLFITGAFLNQILEYISTDFPHDYVNQDGFWDFDSEEKDNLCKDVQEVKDFLKEMNFDTHFLIFTYY